MQLAPPSAIMTRLSHLSALLLAASAVAHPGCLNPEEDSGDDDAVAGDGKADGAVASIATAIRGKSFTLPSSALHGPTSASLAKGSYLAIDLPVTGYAAIRTSVIGFSHVNLKTRGEAHVTVITPPELGALSRKLSMTDLNSLARTMNVSGGDLQAQCVGVGKKSLADQTVYVVVTSQRIADYRARVATLFVDRGGAASAFDATAYHPHATIGFTKRDLHEADGVIKDVASCPDAHNLTVQ